MCEFHTKKTTISSDFVRGKGEAPPAIDDISCRQLLRKSVAAICAHTGFDSKINLMHTSVQWLFQRVKVMANKAVQS